MKKRNMQGLPRISIVTACYNMVDYISATIDSVVRQHYPALEYIVIDGGSSDGTIAEIHKRKNHISKFIVQNDAGQYHAIQKGLSMASGDVVAWLNGDDTYFPWTLSVVGEVFSKFNDVRWIIGTPAHLNEKGHCIGIGTGATCYPRNYIKNGWFRPHLGGYLLQESMFWRRDLWEQAGGFDLSYKYAADFELWTRFAQFTDLVSVSIPLAAFRHLPHKQISAVHRDEYEAEVSRVCRKLKLSPALWNLVASGSLVRQSLCRMFIWEKTRVIAYSRESQEWVMKAVRLPLSRIAVASLLLEKQLRRR